MVLLRVLTGSAAGTSRPLRRFPGIVGRSATSDFQLTDAGVWERHLEISLEVPAGFRARRLGAGHVVVNGENRDDTLLRNGDVIDLGAARLQFWLSEVRQTSLAMPEFFTWMGLTAVVAAQLALLFCLT